MKKLLFTPGPLSTSQTVKAAAMEDIGSRDALFVDAVKQIREELLTLGQVSKEEGYETVLMQGSGTFGVESVISSVIGENDHLLVLSNGAYGERIVKMCSIHKLPHTILRFEEDEITDPAAVRHLLEQQPHITHVACIHSETTTGLFNPIEAIGAICAELGKTFIVDAMSSFGGVALDIRKAHIQYLVSSSNKCIEGIPGFAFIIAEKQALLTTKGQARSLSLDLYEQWQGLEANGQFRFTPPTLSIMAFRQALQELREEGGIPAREARYRKNKATLDKGMEALGFKQYLRPEIQGHIITSFLYPNDPSFHFEQFYQQLSDRNFVIYPGKLSKTNAFRIGNIGQIFPADVAALVQAISEIMQKQTAHA
ncbi:2-aminoethylphosphonate--pyruvate transaminase [Chitinophaga pollutisoli]|uniref:2-aminoethylphosphonate--pyruvate transaminase n=1 Tax=Chitinophaga pollutisoli TaxID=3133966 RepID=A0ABZ2YVP0_9BACT